MYVVGVGQSEDWDIMLGEVYTEDVGGEHGSGCVELGWNFNCPISGTVLVCIGGMVTFQLFYHAIVQQM